MRILLFLIGLLLLIVGGACAAPSFVTFRTLDSDGYVNGEGRMTTTTAALVTNTGQFKEITEKEVEENRVGGDTILRIRAESTDGGDVLIAIGPADAVQSYLVRGSSETIDQLDFDPFDYVGTATGSRRALPEPDEALFVESASGPGPQEIEWTVQAGEWRAVIMNADGSPAVDVDVRFGVKFPYLRGFAIAGMIIGTTLFVVGAAMLVLAFRLRGKPEDEEQEPAPAS